MTIRADIRKMNKVIRSVLYRLSQNWQFLKRRMLKVMTCVLYRVMVLLLEGHANSAFNQDWLVVRVGILDFGKQTGSLDEEAGEEGNRYENTLFLIPQQTLAQSIKASPNYSWYKVAHVTGTGREEIHCDEWGRVKLQFPWDRLGNL